MKTEDRRVASAASGRKGPSAATKGAGFGRRGATTAAAVLAALALGALAALIFRGGAELNRLESRNDSERALNALLGGLRDHDDFGAAIEASPELRRTIVGVGIFGTMGELLYSWGSLPSSAVARASPDADETGEGSSDRIYRERPRSDSLALILKTSRLWPPPPKRPDDEKRRDPPPGTRGPQSSFFEKLRLGEYLYLEMRATRYFGTKRILAALLPTTMAAIAGLAFALRLLVLRNAEYRERIEAQKSLVVLGTAAGTLAHEIKNPLFAIRLQTNLLARTLPGERRPELDIIDAEVERLSVLSYRVGDYLRDPRGSPERVEIGEVAEEVSRRLMGGKARNTGGDRRLVVLADPERLRSILENLLRNALESGSPEAEVGVEIAAESGKARLDVLDRGRGLEGGDPDRVFDPFYTTKSRGSGIGLPISRRFARAMGGDVRLMPREGGGLCARLVLPLAPPEFAAGAEGGAP